MTTPFADLQTALTAVDWNSNVNSFLASSTSGQRVADANLRLAIWARQFESVDHGNPALAFVREMQHAGQMVPVLLALGLYRPAAASMRAMAEAALYYSFFRTHLVELATLVRGQGYYVTREAIIAFHKAHTPDFVSAQSLLGMLSSLESWYGQISAIVHGQVPGVWGPYQKISSIKVVPATEKIVVKQFIAGEDAVYKFFLCTTGRSMWLDFSTAAKKKLLKGLPESKRQQLGLDAA